MAFKLNIDNNNSSDFKLIKPQILGVYRSDTTPVSSNVKDLYLKLASRPLNKSLDLEDGFNVIAKKNVINNKFESLLEWILLNKQLVQQRNQLSFAFINHTNSLNEIDFVATNGTLSFLLKHSYELDLAFTILAEKLNSTIYLKINKKFQPKTNLTNSKKSIQKYQHPNHHQQKQLQNKSNQQNDFELNNYCEQKFRDYFTDKMIENGDDNSFEQSRLNQWISFGKKAVVENKIDEKITFVFEIKIKKHNVLFSDETDCFEQNGALDNEYFPTIKFKLSRKSPYERAGLLSLRKLRWWSIGALSHVRRLIVGFWLDKHIVNEVKEFTLNDLKCSSFDENVCFNNLNQILSFIKNGFNMLDTNSISVVHTPFSKELTCYKSNQKVLPNFYREKMI